MKCSGMQALQNLERVRTGQLSSLKYKSLVQSCLLTSHGESEMAMNWMEEPPASHVTYADLEPVDHKYLLCGLADGGVTIYDTTLLRVDDYFFREVGSIKGGQRGTHKYPVDCVQWYPADAGLFSTSSRDKKVKIWDPNRMKLVDQFSIDCHVHHHQMSPVATKHSLLAVAGDSGEVILCDLRTGTSTHRLQGHEGAVKATHWSPRIQHLLLSSGQDHTVRMWDVRASRAFLMALDPDTHASEGHRKVSKRMKKVPQAHKSQVVSLSFTHDGLWILTFDCTGKLKLWDSSTGKKKDVNYGGFPHQCKRSVRMAVTPSMYPDLVFLPSKDQVCVLEIFTGHVVNVLERHFAPLYGVIYNPSTMHLYTFSSDHNFITWIPKRFGPKHWEESYTDEPGPNKRKRVTQDNWSSDEN